MWTDHKNLSYIQSAKRLNSRWARWVLFFGRFSFSLTYLPGFRNVKPDALSWQFSAEESSTDPEPILLPSCFIATITWEIESLIRQTEHQHPDPGNPTTRCPRLCLLSGPTVGPLLSSDLSSWYKVEPYFSPSEVLVTHHGIRHLVFYISLRSVHSKQVFNQAHLWPAPSPAGPRLPLVPTIFIMLLNP